MAHKDTDKHGFKRFLNIWGEMIIKKSSMHTGGIWLAIVKKSDTSERKADQRLICIFF